MSRRQRGYPWPSLAISPYHSSPAAGLQGYILCPHTVAVCKFVLVVLLLHIHKWGSTGVHRLRIPNYIYIYIYIYQEQRDRGWEREKEREKEGEKERESVKWERMEGGREKRQRERKKVLISIFLCYLPQSALYLFS